MILIAAVALAAVQAEPNCKEPRWQPEMTTCAYLDYQAADEAMNLQWKPLLARMKERDRDFERGRDKLSELF